MDCVLPLIHRLVDLASHPLGFFLLTHDLYSDYVTSLTGERFLHALPALVMVGAVAFRLFRSKEVNKICKMLRCRMNKTCYYVCNFLCAHWLLNMTLVSFLSLQDFVHCTTSSNCNKRPSFPAVLWTNAAPCPTTPSNVGHAIIAAVTLVGALILWQPDILCGYIGIRLKQRHGLAHWLIKKIASRLDAPVADENSQENHDFESDCEVLENDFPDNSIQQDDNNSEN